MSGAGKSTALGNSKGCFSLLALASSSIRALILSDSPFSNEKRAGKLIKDAGLKGYTVGGAQVSEKHSGFVVNRGGATAEEVAFLIKQVQKKVMKKFNVMMQPEVRFVGARDSCRKLKTGESGIPCSSGCSAKQSTRLHFNYCILHRNCLEVLTYLDNHSSKTFVRYQQVTSITHNKKRNPRFFWHFI